MTFQEALDFLYQQLPVYQRQGAAAMKKDLGNIRALCEILGNPHLKYPVVHLAGTNGKGSTTHLIASILQEAGYQTGMYVSPHYFDFRERIKINGNYISKQAVLGFLKRIMPHLSDIQPSFFELTVAMAFDYFARKKVDVAVIETGLGGRLDSTNIVSPILSIITNISKDHQQFLGDTLLEIAGEKAGIIKAEIPVIIGESQAEVSAVFEKKAKELGSEIQFADQLLAIDIEKDHFILQGKEANRFPSFLDRINKGPFFSKNLITALISIQKLKELGWDIAKQDIKKGLSLLYENTRFFGRWEVLSEHPLTIIDGAHNVGGLQLIKEELSALKPEKIHFVFGVVADKSLEDILPLLPKGAEYYFVKAGIPRALSANQLKEKAKDYGLKGEAFGSVLNGYASAKKKANIGDLIFIGGSIFVAGEILANRKRLFKNS